MRRQHFLTELQDVDGRIVDFERWPYRTAKTVLQKSVELYGGWGAPLYAESLNRSTQIALHKTAAEPTSKNLVQVVPIAELRRMVADYPQQEKEQRVRNMAALAAQYEQEAHT